LSDPCKYHPQRQASWHCSTCAINFCFGCISSENGELYPQCVLCRRTLLRQSNANQTPSIGQQLPKILSTSASGKVLLLVSFFSLAFTLIPTGLFGDVVFLIFLIPLTEFLFDSMEQTASGDTLRPSLSRYFSLRNNRVFFKFLLTFVLTLMLLIKLGSLNSGASLLLGAFFVLGIPASAMILMMEKSMLAMLNPIKISFIIRTLGSAYLLLFILSSAVALTLMEFNRFASGNEIGFLAEFLLTGAVLYLITTIFLIAGYLIFQYHTEFNFTLGSEAMSKLSQGEQKEALYDVNIFVQEGRYEDAQTTLLKRIQQNPLDYLANEKLIKLSVVRGNDKLARQLAKNYFSELTARGKYKHAADFYVSLQNQLNDFLLDESQAIISICEAMKNKHHFKLALQTIENQISIDKMPKDWERLHLLYAQLLTEFANRKEEARKSLKLVINRSINQEYAKTASDYLDRFISV